VFHVKAGGVVKNPATKPIWTLDFRCFDVTFRLTFSGQWDCQK